MSEQPTPQPGPRTEPLPPAGQAALDALAKALRPKAPQ